jgi:hypothetical protein
LSNRNPNHDFVPANRDPVIPGWAGASAYVGRSIASLKRDVRLGVLAAPFEAGPGRIAWRQSVLDAHLAGRPVRHYPFGGLHARRGPRVVDTAGCTEREKVA